MAFAICRCCPSFLIACCCRRAPRVSARSCCRYVNEYTHVLLVLLTVAVDCTGLILTCSCKEPACLWTKRATDAEVTASLRNCPWRSRPRLGAVPIVTRTSHHEVLLATSCSTPVSSAICVSMAARVIEAVLCHAVGGVCLSGLTPAYCSNRYPIDYCF